MVISIPEIKKTIKAFVFYIGVSWIILRKFLIIDAKKVRIGDDNWERK
jgi:hypothetical protein